MDLLVGSHTFHKSVPLATCPYGTDDNKSRSVRILDACFWVISGICCTCIKGATNPVQIISRNNNDGVMVSNETPGNATSPPVRTTLVRQTPTKEPSRGGEERGRPTLVESPPSMSKDLVIYEMSWQSSLTFQRSILIRMGH